MSFEFERQLYFMFALSDKILKMDILRHVNNLRYSITTLYCMDKV